MEAQAPWRLSLPVPLLTRWLLRRGPLPELTARSPASSSQAHLDDAAGALFLLQQPLVGVQEVEEHGETGLLLAQPLGALPASCRDKADPYVKEKPGAGGPEESEKGNGRLKPPQIFSRFGAREKGDPGVPGTKTP